MTATRRDGRDSGFEMTLTSVGDTDWPAAGAVSVR